MYEDDELHLIGSEQAAEWRGALPVMPPEDVMQLLTDPATGPVPRRRVLTTITTPLATMLLDRYAQSRPLNPRVAERIARHLQNPDPEGEMFEEVRVAADGRAIAGQHLLHAVVNSGCDAPNTPLVLGADLPPWLDWLAQT